jgi:hypothetical protein
MHRRLLILLITAAESPGEFAARPQYNQSAMKTTIGLTLAAVGVLISALPLSAHHAFAAEFDVNKPVKLEGTVVKIEMVNPHAWFHVAVKNPDGTTTEWMIEGGSPNALIRHGFTKSSIPVGTPVIVEGYEAKDGSHRANGRDITFPGGKKIYLGSSAPDSPPPPPDDK